MAHLAKPLDVVQVAHCHDNQRDRLPGAAAGIELIHSIDGDLLYCDCYVRLGIKPTNDDKGQTKLEELPFWVLEYEDIGEAVDILRNVHNHTAMLETLGQSAQVRDKITYNIVWKMYDKDPESVEFILTPHVVRRQLPSPVKASELTWTSVNDSWEVALVDKEIEADEKFDPLEDPISHKAPILGDVLYHRKGTSMCLSYLTVRSLLPLPTGTETTQSAFLDLAI